MDIEWYGQSCFKIREGNFNLITDPYDKSIGYTLPRNLKADVVTVSHDAPGHSAVGQVKATKVLTRPGEYEVRGVFITGIQSWRGSGVKGEAKEENTVFVFEFGDLTVCHLGDLSRVLTQAQVESMPDVHILLAPVGGGGALDADKAAQVISQLEPRIIVPMHYQTEYGTDKLDPLTRFLKEMGVAEHQAQESIRVTKGSLPQETQVMVLECKQGAQT